MSVAIRELDDVTVLILLGIITAFADSSSLADLTWFTAYHAYNSHITWLNELRTQFPNRSSIVTSGNSVEGRPITGIHIFGSGGSGSKPAVLFHGNVHAREWITSKVRPSSSQPSEVWFD